MEVGLVVVMEVVGMEVVCGDGGGVVGGGNNIGGGGNVCI